jgi:hypothetical protein
VLELSVESFLAVKSEARMPEVCNEFSDFAGQIERVM